MTTAQLTLVSSYDYRLVTLSVLMAVFASYVALDLAGRVMGLEGKTRLAWLIGGATAMGTGIWAMHYVGMLAFRLPIPVEYDWPTALASLIAAIFACVIALFVVSRSKMNFLRALVGSVFMGGAIAGMHYTGMAAMRLSAMCHYSRGMVSISIVLAVLISWVALALAFHFKGETKLVSGRKLLSTVVMGVAIPLMHYTGMAAASFTPSDQPPDLSHAVSISTLGMTGIVVVTLLVLGLAVLTSLFDRLYSAQKDFSQAMINSLPGLFYVFDEKGQLLRGNKSLEIISGYSSDELSRMTVLDFFKEADRKLVSERMEEVLSTGKAVVESTFVAKDRTETPYLFSGKRLLFNGKPCVIGLGVDISERIRIEAESRLKSAALNAAANGIVITGANGAIQWVNPEFVRLTGYKLDDVIGQNPRILNSGKHDDAVL
jgi:PAS domain S-box-containing protein